MLRQKAAIRVLSLILSLTFICGQVFAGQASFSAPKDTMAPSLVSDTDINPGRTEGFIKDIKPGAIGNGRPLLEIAKGNLPQRLTLEDREIVKLREAIRLAVVLSTAYSQPEHRQIVKATIYNLINFSNNLQGKTYLYNLIAEGPEDYSAGFGLTDSFSGLFTGLTKELVDRLSIEDLAQYIFHENVPESDVILKEIKDGRSSHRAVYNEIQTPIFGKEAVERLGKEIRAAINEKLLPLAEAALRTPINAGNWKMAVDTQYSAHKLVRYVESEVVRFGYRSTEIIIAPSFVHLSSVKEASRTLLGHISIVKLAAQDVSFNETGAFTGQTSVRQLKDLGVSHIIIGHSERRGGETPESSALINKKVKTAIKKGFSVILCVGEDLKEFETGKTKKVIEDQIRNSLAGLTAGEMKKVVIAYEPVWAIGTGKVATPEQANDNQRYIRALLLDIFGFETAAATRILYGGSVKPDNIKELTRKPNIDGALVGGASLKGEDFVSIGRTINDERPNKEEPAAGQPSLAEVFRPWAANEPSLLKHKVAINGFGRIGKLFFKAYLENTDNNFEIVAVNDLDKIENLAHLFRYDSTFGNFKGEVKVEGDNLIINGQRIKVLSEKDPAKLPWKDLGVETVLESSGRFTKRADANKHIEAGAKKVVISAPGEEEDLTVVLGINQEVYDSKTHHIISNASCTTNCLAPVVEVLEKKFGVESGLMITIHSATNDQNVLDTMHKDQRRARATIGNIIPTTTGAAKAIGKVIPDLKGKLDGMAMRVPTGNVSAIYLSAVLKKNATAKEINAALKEAAAQGPLSQYLGYTEDALVSSDFLRNPKSATVDASLTKVVGDRHTSVVAWYDNEWGYSNRLVELVNHIFGKPAAPAAAESPKAQAGKAQASSAATFAEFVEMAKAEAKALKIEAKGLGRIFVVGVSGSNASKAALEIGSSVGATRTFIPEYAGNIGIIELVRDLKSYYQKYGFGLVIVAHGAKIEKDETNEELFNAALKKDGAARAIYEMAKEKGIDKGGYLQFEKYADIITAILSAELGKKEIGITVSQAGDIDYDTTVTAGSGEKQAGIGRIDEEKYHKANAALFAEDEVKTIETVSGFDVFAPLKENTIRYGILTGGGLASGHNQVIAEAVREASRQAEKLGKNIEIIGLKSGWAGLIKEKLVNQAHLLTLEEVGKYENQGGSILGTSRTNPYSKENIEKGVPQILAENIKKLQLHGLITCGGDDTNGAAAKLQAQFPALSFIGVPKTMDNDIPLPGGAPNYGNRTFIEAGILRGQAYKKIAQQEKKIIVFETFGRNSGFAALGVGAGIGATRTLVREEGVIDFDKMAGEIEAFYNKNGYAVVCVAEGIKTDIKGNEAIFDAAFKIDPVARAFYDEAKGKVDDFGHPKLKGAGRIITAILKAKLADKGIVVAQKGNLDYGPRSADISSTDLKMTKTLGKAVITKLLEGKKDIILYVDNDGNAGEMDLQKELGGRVADIKEGGANYREYLSANRAFSQKAAAAQNVTELLGNIKDTTQVTKDSVTIIDRSKFVSETVDYLAFEAALSQNPDVKSAAQRILREAALTFKLKLASINDFYMAKQEGKWANITVPAVNGRADVYHQYQQLFRVAKEKNVGALIVELARSEMRYSAQDAAEFTTISIASAIKQGYEGLIFAQGDHYQVNKEKYNKGGEDREKELKAIEALILKTMQAGMYNIDLDPSTLVDETALKQIVAFETEIVDRYLKDHPQLIAGLDENGIKSVRRKLVDEIETGKIELLTPGERSHIEALYRDMHKTSAEVTMRFIRYIRKLEKELGFPEGFHVSIGIEERHIDNPEHKNNPSTVLGSVALMQIVLDTAQREGLTGPSKISLQTGTMHGVGGKVDFGIYQRHLEHWKRIGVAVFVQHGASTLEKQDFDKMREGDVGEVHLATEYQKIELDVTSRLLPKLGEDMARYLYEMMKKDAKMGAKFGPMWELASGNPKPAIDTIKPEDKKKEEKIALYTKLADVQSGKDRAATINEILGDTLPKGLKGTLKDLVKELPGPFKRQLMNLSKEPRAAVDKALYEEFSTILHKLGATDTKSILEEVVPFDKQPVIMPARPEALQKAAAALDKTTKTTEPAGAPAVESAPVSIEKELPYRAEVFKANLLQILAEHRDQVFFIGIETDIGEAQKAQIMPVYKAIDEIEKMTDSAGKRLFPNLMVKRATANELVTIATDLWAEGKLNLNNTFIGARKVSVDNKAYDAITGRAWISAIDDSSAGDYLPVFEAVTLNMMAYVNADLAAIKSFYDAISDKPIDPGVLQDMLKNKIIIILPRATKLDTKQLRELYELAQQIYLAA